MECNLRKQDALSSLFKHNSSYGKGPEMGLNWAWDGLVGVGLVKGYWQVRCITLFVWKVIGLEGLGFSIFSLQITSSSFGGDGGLVMWDGPEMFGIVCACSVVSVDGPENGEFISVLIGQMCCLLHLYLWPWASIMYGLGVWPWPTVVPSVYDIWSAGLRNRMSCLGAR